MPPDSALPSDRLRECPGCGRFHALPALRPGQVADCLRCGSVLARRRRDPLRRGAALALTGLVLYGVAVGSNLLGMDLRGQERTATILSEPAALEGQGMTEIALVVLATTVVAPLLRLLAVLAVLLGLRRARPPAVLRRLWCWQERLAPWAMVEVFLLGAFVAYTRLGALAQVEVGPALYALGGLMLATVATDAVLDRDAVWETLDRCLPRSAGPSAGEPIGCDLCGLVSRAAAGAPCPRCGDTLRARKPNSLARTWALLLAAAILYVPANVYPVMTVIRFGRGAPSTILGGVGELIAAGMWPLALLVFVASVTVPMLKLGALTVMLVATGRGSARSLRARTRLYRVVDVVGRWSMIDVFMLSILTALVRMGAIASVIPGDGATAFAAVVILTMLAAFSFDPRLMWDAAEQPTAAPGGRAMEAA